MYQDQFFSIVQNVLLQEIPCKKKAQILFTAANELDMEILTLSDSDHYFNDFLELIDIYVDSVEPESVETPLSQIQSWYEHKVSQIHEDQGTYPEDTVEQEAAEDLRRNTLSSIS